MKNESLLEELGYLLAGAVNLSNPKTQGGYRTPLEIDYFFYEETALDLVTAALAMTRGLNLTEQELNIVQNSFLEHTQTTQSRAQHFWDQILYQCQLHPQYDYQSTTHYPKG